MPNKKAIYSISKLPQGTSACITIDGKGIALFHEGGQVYAMDNACPHRGGPLASGIVKDQSVSCPLHGWKFNLTNGELSSNPAIRVSVYPVSLEGETIYIELPEVC